MPDYSDHPELVEALAEHPELTEAFAEHPEVVEGLAADRAPWKEVVESWAGHPELVEEWAERERRAAISEAEDAILAILDAKPEPKGKLLVEYVGSAPSPIDLIAAWSLAPLMAAFATEIGKRLGGTTADWLERMKAVRYRRLHKRGMLWVETPRPTGFEITEGMSDEAKLALIDTDLSDPAIQGRVLRWNAEAGAWQAIL
jgi:hypothetical protein